MEKSTKYQQGYDAGFVAGVQFAKSKIGYTTKEAGQKGAKARHGKSSEELSAIAKKAANTRRKKNPNAFIEMGQKGGSAKAEKYGR